ncbi:MAG: DinB family protein [Gemmatimonadetes bacterium]|nr:DinB family protein [Gemmatimonadota bacterium]MDA1102327.1 DinB family protein [Gemmatimonadota bacterium]
MRGARTAPLAVLVSICAAAACVSAQSTPPNFLEEFEGQFEASASKLVALAAAMPPAAYSWSPGEGVASVASVYMHIARYNYMYPDENLGLTTPISSAEYDRWEESVTDKAEVVAILAASMDYVREVAGAMSDDQLEESTMLYGRRVGQWAVLLQLVTHMNEHLGQSIAYARMNQIVPPWSR